METHDRSGIKHGGLHAKGTRVLRQILTGVGEPTHAC